MVHKEAHALRIGRSMQERGRKVFISGLPRGIVTCG